MRIRVAIPTDRPAIAAVHTASWRTAYRGSLPDAYLDGALEEEMRRNWAGLEIAAGDVVLVAEDEGIAGFIAVWCRPEPYLDNLHVLPERRSQGIGRELMIAAAAKLQRLGHSTIYLWVFEANRRAIGFYESLGGVRTAQEDKDIFGHKVPNLKIEWRDLTVIGRRAGS